MDLNVVELFPTVQGEGSLAGSPALFLRLSGCNMWSGLEKDRERGIGDCSLWCDTMFARGEEIDIDNLSDNCVAMMASWQKPLMVITGGEPMLQLRKDAGIKFLEKMKEHGVYLCLETNGTIKSSALELFDHITVSPKLIKSRPDYLKQVKVRKGTDLKVVMPQWTMDQLLEMGGWDFEHKFIQPLDCGTQDGWDSNTKVAIETATDLGWRISVQTHKLIGLP